MGKLVSGTQGNSSAELDQSYGCQQSKLGMLKFSSNFEGVYRSNNSLYICLAPIKLKIALQNVIIRYAFSEFKDQ